MSDLPMKQEDHPAYNLPDATEDHSGTEYQVNAGPKTDKAGADPYPNADDNMFMASGRDAQIIRAKREMISKTPGVFDSATGMRK